jgi:hypothetical protein
MLMQEIQVTPEMVIRAMEKSKEMGRLHNSITLGQGNIAGFIGEQVALHVLGGKEHNTYDYDLVTDAGFRVDVKTKRTSVTPKESYECSVAELNTKQECDYYAFVRVHNDMHTAWFLGVYPKEDYFKAATFLEKGQVDPSNNFTVKSDCYNIAISELKVGI